MPGFFVLNIFSLNIKLYICLNFKNIKMENQHNEEHLTPEELAEKKEQMLEFYTDSLPYLDAQLVYEQKLLAIDEARFKRMSLQMQYAMMMNEAKNAENGEEDDLEYPEAETPKRKLKKD